MGTNASSSTKGQADVYQVAQDTYAMMKGIVW